VNIYLSAACDSEAS